MRRIESVEEFFELLPRKKNWCAENITLKHGVKYKLYSPYSDTYSEGTTGEHTDVELLKIYIYEGNIYEYNSEDK